MQLRKFESPQAMHQATENLLRRAMGARTHAEALPGLQPGRPYGIMLSGGSTPMPAYRALADSAVWPADDLHVLFSDERVVRPDDERSNYGNTLPMLRAMNLPDERVLRVRGELGLEEAAARFENDLAAFFRRGGSVPLGLLGLGADGHTASLFSPEDVARGKGMLAQAVSRDEGPDRVSVSAEFLSRIGRIVFLVRGADKAAVVDRLLREPESIAAGRAIASARHVEIWVA